MLFVFNAAWLDFMLNTSFLEDTIGGVPGFDGVRDADTIFAIFAPILMGTFSLPVQ
jgi:hypothetical protein